MKNDEKEPETREGFFGRMWKKFGEVAKMLGLISDSDIVEALAKQQASSYDMRIGEILVEDEKITMAHVDRVLKDQKKSTKEKKKVSRKKATGTTAKKAAVKKASKSTAKKAVRKKASKSTAKKAAGKKAAKTTAKKAAGKKAAKTTAKKAAGKKAAMKTAVSKKRQK